MVPQQSPWSPPGGMPKATEPPCQAAAPTPGWERAPRAHGAELASGGPKVPL